MTIDITFWRQKPDATAEPSEIYGRVCQGADPLADLEALPLDEIRSALSKRLAGFDVNAEWQALELPDEDAGCEISIDAKYCRFDIGGNCDDLEHDLRQIFASFGCTCFEGATGRATAPGEAWDEPPVDVDAINRRFERERHRAAQPSRKSTVSRAAEGAFDDLPDAESFYDLDPEKR